jgi:branched-chain amino acid transport system substrate-binding protein
MRQLQSRLFAAVGLIALFAASPAGAQTAAPAQPAAAAVPANAVKLGVIGPFSGPSSDFGNPMLHGIQLAVEEINAVGGYLGRPLVLVVKDDQGNPDVGLKGSQELAAAGVVATIGFCNTGVAMKALDVYQTRKVAPDRAVRHRHAADGEIPGPESYIFRTSARDAIQAPFVVDDIVKRGWTNVAIFADTTGYGEAGLKDVEAALAAKNLKAVYVARFPLGVKDVREQLKAAREAGANVVFSYTVGPENAAIANSRRDLKWNVPQVGAWPLSFPFFIDGAKDAADGALMAQTFIAEPSNERRSSFLSAYSRKFKQRIAVPMAAAQSYDATYLLAYALFGIRDGQLNGPAVKAALENIPRVYYGVVATYERPFTREDKDAITQNMLVMGKVRAGAVTFAYPEDAKRNLIVQRKKMVASAP